MSIKRNHLTSHWLNCTRLFGYLLLWINAVGIGLCAPQVSDAPASSVTRRIVSQYALTSANDFPERDPQDWDLSGSNDGGTTWTLLDTRRGELFSERHQRRVFTIANRTPYNIYRLRIKRVRVPGSGASVQLAEIEPMAANPADLCPLPLFADAISAEGANPPVESAEQAFDGLVETKWLDFAESEPATRASWIQWQYRDQSHLVITNLLQLNRLRGRAAESYPVRIEAVLLGRADSTHELCVLDSAGNTEFIPGPENFLPGQRLLVQGQSQTDGTAVAIDHPRILAAGPAPAAKPIPIVPGEPLHLKESFQWVESQGTVQFVTTVGTRLEFELWANGHSLSVQVSRFATTNTPPTIGSHVAVRGVCEIVLNDAGEPVAGTIRTPDLGAVSTLSAPEVSTSPVTTPGRWEENGKDAILAEEGPTKQLGPQALAGNHSVRLRGVITEPFGLFIQQGAEGFALMWPEGGTLRPPGLGEYVEIEGRTGARGAQGAAITVDSVRILGKGKLPEAATPSWSQLADGQMNGKWIEVDAIVRATDGSHLLLFSQGWQMMATLRSAPAAFVAGLVDAEVRLHGVCLNATDNHNLLQGIQLLVPSQDYVMIKEPAVDPATMPAHSISNLFNLISVNKINHRVKIKGTLTCQDGREYFVQDADGSIMAVGQFNVILTEQSQGSHWVFWQIPNLDGFTQPTRQLSPGDEVEVVGFPEVRRYAPMLAEAVIRKVGMAKPILPIPTTAEALSSGQLDSTVVSLDGRVLGSETLGPYFVIQMESGAQLFHASLQYKAMGIPNVASGSRVRVTGVCQMDDMAHPGLGRTPVPFTILLRTPSDIAVLETPPWWTARRALAAAGITVLVLMVSLIWIRTLHRRVHERTRQLQQEVADHEKTEKRLAQETKLLQKEIEARTETEAALAKKSEALKQEIEERKDLYALLQKRTATLENEIKQREKAQAEVERIHRQLLSASRLAGMADVATNVLHNVGNVLNSVNVLASSIARSVQRSKIPGVARVASLLAENRADLGRFLTEDENGLHVPGHLERLGAHLLEEQRGLQEKMDSLNESIRHLKEVVAMQQNFTKVAGVLETLPLPEVVEDASKICSESMARHGIKMVYDYQDLPPMTIDRHKVLQILFNLLENAKHACEAQRNCEGCVTVRIREGKPGRILLQVVDNGIGIPPENLDRIFTQGFSTRKGGHGFGLHSSILAAEDMGGSLRAESPGAGRGATFTLELPKTVRASAATKPNDLDTLAKV